jgi:benzoyl-CoA-dihydrodiol lyase
MISFETSPDRYPIGNSASRGRWATLTLDIAEDKPLVPGYKLKLNSYDLGVDIELADALNRIRFEHPEVKSVVITSGKSACSAPAPTSTCSATRATRGR